MDDPTLAEMIRGLRADVQRLIDREALYVTQEQRATDRELFELKIQGVTKDQQDLEKAQAASEARLAAVTRWFWTVLVGPVIVGVILYLVTGSKP